ncbi:MAG TPA: hypothetical protein VFG07_04055 [Thermoplasmata archaeon]|nr:hypothetical protein [Thermoplasmata archaeon]
MPRTSLRPGWSLALGISGIVLLLASVGLGWWDVQTSIDPWTIAGHEYRFDATSTFLPGPFAREHCSTNNTSMPGWGYICANTEPNGFLDPYANPELHTTQVAALYSALELLLLLTVIVVAVGVALLSPLWIRRGRPRAQTLRVGWWFLLVAALLALALPTWVAVAQPIAIGQDEVTSGNTSPPPGGAHSFWGSCGGSATPCGMENVTMTWGAGLGWFTCLGAGIFFLGLVVQARSVLRRPSPPA